MTTKKHNKAACIFWDIINLPVLATRPIDGLVQDRCNAIANALGLL